METFNKKDFFKIGFLQKISGVKGEIVLQFDQCFKKSLEKKPVLFFEIDNLLVPWFISNKGLNIKGNTLAVLKIDWIDSKEQSQKFLGTLVYIKKKDFEKEEGNENFLFNENNISGYSIEDEQLGLIGTIEKIENYSGNILFQITWKGKKILLPFHEDFFVRLDKEKKLIVLHCPEGILNIN